MSIKSLNPYLMFDGNAAQAIALYEKALGARADGVMRFSDGPPQPGQTLEPKDANRIMHALLRIGSNVIMLSDSFPGMGVPKTTNTQVCIEFTDKDDMAWRFDALAAGGTVRMPLQDTFWGAKFGMLEDAYGINWMFNCTTKKA